jgi:hypothetical protein
MSVGVTKDYKLKVRNLHASHTQKLFHFIVVYFQQYKKRAQTQGKKKCHTETMRGRKSLYNLYIREPLMCRLGRTSRSKNKGRS